MSFYFPMSSPSCAGASRSFSVLSPYAERPPAAHFFDMLRQSPVYGSSPLLPPVSFLRSELSPIVCMSCHKRGHFICENCYTRLPFISPSLACHNCASPYGWLSCTACDEPWELVQTSSVLELSQLVRRMITDFKDRGELRLAVVIAALLSCYFMQFMQRFHEDELSARVATPAPTSVAPALTPAAISAPARPQLPAFLHPDCVCFVPATSSAYRRRGFDHMELVAKNFCAYTRLPFADIALRPQAADQRKLSRTARLANLSGSISILKDCSGLSFLILDDVITTGASIRELASALRARGAREVAALSFARAW